MGPFKNYNHHNFKNRGSDICQFGGLGGPGGPGGPRRPLQRVGGLPHTFWNARMHLCFANVDRYPCCQNVPLYLAIMDRYPRELGPLPWNG